MFHYTKIFTLPTALLLLAGCSDPVQDRIIISAAAGALAGGAVTGTREGIIAGAVLGGLSAAEYGRRSGAASGTNGFAQCDQRYGSQAERNACYQGVRRGMDRAQQQRVRDARSAGYRIGLQH